MGLLDTEALTGCTWYQFERLTFRLLQHTGWTGLMFTSKSHDQGADLVGSPPGKSYSVVIQCKHTRSSTIGKKGVEDLIRACDFYGVSRGILATNAKLSGAAKSRLATLRGQYKIKVWDFKKLSSISERLEEKSAAWKKPREYQEDATDEVLATFNS